MKSFKLIAHQKGFSDDEILISQKEYPEANLNDVIEIYHPPPVEEENQNANEFEEENPRLLLQIKIFRDDMVQPKTISVEQSIAAVFGLQTYKNVMVNLVNPKDFALDSVELTFKDQYMGRSEMWRLKNSLVNTCVYMSKKLEFCGGAVRCQVYEMWALGERVASGVITNDTKIVFRSSTAMVYIFLQMSSEMWDFDIYGDLYFEKAVNGFLSDLFMKWKKNSSNHEVTIVLFSRTFYEVNNLEEFPQHMRECLQKDYRGRYYEDFYRVAIQNERYDEWCNILVLLRKIFQDYLHTVLRYHERVNYNIPAACNSTAAQGNFLEVLNMSLNVFEKHYLDRSLDRTGQLSVVVTPGVGVFEVDRELSNITKQRIIDGGVGSDLVCVGEQPLHAVPLLKFHNKDAHLNVPDDYSMPHWINLSFYSTNKKIPYSNFIPRIKLPPHLVEKNSGMMKESSKRELLPEDECIHNSFFDYDAYDTTVFQFSSSHHLQEFSTSHTKMIFKYKKSSGILLDNQEMNRGIRRKMSDPDLYHQKNDFNRRSEPIAIPSATTIATISPQMEDKEFSPPIRMVVGSEGSPPHESRALINPFDPSHVTIKLTSNRRRWTHIFPKGPTGVLIQQHHYQAVPTQSDLSLQTRDIKELNNILLLNNKSITVTSALQEFCKKRPAHISGSQFISTNKHSSKSSTLLWGATGEQEWTPALTTGVDWKSLTIPACLPMTTDYFPDRRTLHTDYLVSLYSLIPDSVYADFAQPVGPYKKPLTTDEVFRELISQRLAQGFQLILMDGNRRQNGTPQNIRSIRANVLNKSSVEVDETYYLSIGRLFHKISLSGNVISVTRYRPRHPYPGFKYQYRYRFYAPYHDNYEESYSTFTTEKLEHYNWNYLDHYICTGGDSTDFVLVDALKYWRFRVYLLPFNNAETKKILEGSPRCDIYTLPNIETHQQTEKGFLKFIETAVNKLKRSVNASKKPRMSLSVQTLPPLVQPRRNSISSFTQNASSSSPFRERLGSSRLSDKPRLRSGSKVLERSRFSQTSQDQSMETTEICTDDRLSTTMTPLKATSSCIEIIEAFKHQTHGLSFVSMNQNLPNFTFITSEAVYWLIAHMEGVTTIEFGLRIMQNLHREKFIRHASGDSSKPYLFGFHLFHIIEKPEKDDTVFSSSDYWKTFENEFLEVVFKPPLHWSYELSSDADSDLVEGTETNFTVPHSLHDRISSDYLENYTQDLTYKRMRLETDVMCKSDRVEWGHVRYQTFFRPDQAYELIIEWLTSSGSIVAELLFGWHRKAQTCGLQMIPIPHDPLALPYSEKSDPLRGPIFIPLNVTCLEKHNSHFEDFHENCWMEQMFFFQEAIVQKFGFMKSLVELPSNQEMPREHQYIHITGTIFILISNTAPKCYESGISIGKSSNLTDRYSEHADVVPSPHEAYITRHVSGQNKADFDTSKKIGFLWCWNHMISRRWRTNQAIDNNFQIKCLNDFKAFCSNREDRLVTFWEDSCDSIKTLVTQI